MVGCPSCKGALMHASVFYAGKRLTGRVFAGKVVVYKDHDADAVIEAKNEQSGLVCIDCGHRLEAVNSDCYIEDDGGNWARIKDTALLTLTVEDKVAGVYIASEGLLARIRGAIDTDTVDYFVNEWFGMRTSGYKATITKLTIDFDV